MRSTTPGRKNAVSVLAADHVEVRRLLEQLENARATTRQEELLERIEDELRVHTTVEEEIFYPAFRDAGRGADDARLFHEATAEHHVVDIVLPAVKASVRGTPEFAARVKVLKELIEHHASEEEAQMFPRARKLLTGDELAELGERIEDRKTQLRDGSGGSVMTALFGR